MWKFKEGYRGTAGRRNYRGNKTFSKQIGLDICDEQELCEYNHQYQKLADKIENKLRGQIYVCSVCKNRVIFDPISDYYRKIDWNMASLIGIASFNWKTESAISVLYAVRQIGQDWLLNFCRILKAKTIKNKGIADCAGFCHRKILAGKRGCDLWVNRFIYG